MRRRSRDRARRSTAVRPADRPRMRGRDPDRLGCESWSLIWMVVPVMPGWIIGALDHLAADDDRGLLVHERGEPPEPRPVTVNVDDPSLDPASNSTLGVRDVAARSSPSCRACSSPCRRWTRRTIRRSGRGVGARRVLTTAMRKSPCRVARRGGDDGVRRTARSDRDRGNRDRHHDQRGDTAHCHPAVRADLATATANARDQLGACGGEVDRVDVRVVVHVDSCPVRKPGPSVAPQRAERPVRVLLDGAGRDAERVGDVGLAEVGEVAEHDDVALGGAGGGATPARARAA